MFAKFTAEAERHKGILCTGDGGQPQHAVRITAIYNRWFRALVELVCAFDPRAIAFDIFLRLNLPTIRFPLRVSLLSDLFLSALEDALVLVQLKKTRGRKSRKS